MNFRSVYDNVQSFILSQPRQCSELSPGSLSTIPDPVPNVTLYFLLSFCIHLIAAIAQGSSIHKGPIRLLF